MLVLHVAVLLAGAWLAFAGRMSVGTLVAFNAVLLSLSAAVATLTSSAHTFLGAAAGLRRIREILAQQPVADAADARPQADFAKELRFEDVSFAYRDTPILQGLSLRIGHGESVAFVGPSGSGKSTALSLVARFLDPAAGRLTLDGTDLRHITQAALRARMGIVQQDTVLFEGSVRDNLRLGRLDARDAEVEEAARLAQVDAFVAALPQGYDTHLGAGEWEIDRPFICQCGAPDCVKVVAGARYLSPDVLSRSHVNLHIIRAINTTLQSPATRRLARSRAVPVIELERIAA